MVLLETTSGAGSVLGGPFEELAAIRGLCHNADRVGYCVDTCHIFCAGYDIRCREDYDTTVAQMDRALGLVNVKAFHLNDSKGTLGSHVDRHARIGQGELGTNPFRYLVNDLRFATHPGILEVPGGPEAYAEDLALLRSFQL
jgi:deoxyribonuclease-4